MTEENVVLCRQRDVDEALIRSFKRFVDENKNSLRDLQSLMQEELSTIDSFEVKTVQLNSSEKLTEETNVASSG